MKPNNSGQKSFRLIPDGDHRCVWMDLGVVSYKICDRDFDCDNCPLNEGLAGSELTDRTGAKAVADRRFGQFRLPILSRLAKFETDDNRYFHPSHNWVQVEGPDRATIGIDGILAVVFGLISKVTLPVPGTQLSRSEGCGDIHQGDNVFTICSPVSGQVVQVNDLLESFPDKLVIDSMRGGWLLTIQPDNLDEDLNFCRHGDAVFPWYLKELEWFDSVLSRSFKEKQVAVGETMYDGGELSRNLRDLLPADHYNQLVSSLIGAPMARKR